MASTQNSLVPNQFPLDSALDSVPYRIALVGEAPGKDEEDTGAPFVGMSGRLLKALLAKAGIDPAACFFGNISQVRPPGNDIAHADPDDIKRGTDQLHQDLSTFQPNLCILLGNTPLRKATTQGKITTMRGSLFRSIMEGPFLDRKCLPAYHPAACLRQRDWIPVLHLDLSKGAREGLTPDLRLPQRTLEVDLSCGEICRRLDEINDNPVPISIDIEGGLHSMTCCSVATSPTSCFIVPFANIGGSHYWDEADEVRVWRSFARVLQNPRVPKILQNSLYDNFVLSFAYRCPIVNVAEDTMLKHWELYSELPKGLGFLASVYTDEPYYKDERTVPDNRTHFLYCCKDSAVTMEISDRIAKALGESSGRQHYRFNVELLNPLLYMELRGIRYDVGGAAARRRRIETEWDLCQSLLDACAGRPMNVRSPVFKEFLYDELGLPEVRNRQTDSRTANAEALMNISKKTGHPVPKLGLLISRYRTRHQMLGITSDDDGRIRCGYNLVGTETGRLTCYTSPTGSGYNLQTIPEYDRDLFLADPDCWFFQCDLSGADTWTVAAHCAFQGDDRMLRDLQAGVKPAKMLAYAFTHGPAVLREPPERVLSITDSVAKSDPLYFGAKCCIHGSNYGMGKVLLSATIFKQSDGAVNISARDAQKLQDLYFKRYPGVKRWHDWVQRQLNTRRSLTSASGHRRVFFGMPKEHDTFKQALANEPQENTTYATNLAAYRLWNDPENRDGNRLIVEPLHQVHDALCGQFPKSLTTWSISKIREWFTNEFTIAGQKITIPFDGAYGPSWGQLTEGKI